MIDGPPLHGERTSTVRSSPGPVVLLGGWEHTPGCESIDEFVMETLGTASPRVAIMPVASTPRMLPVAISRADEYWKRLGGTVSVSLPTNDDPRPALDALNGAEIVVLTGGLADRIRPTLLQSGLWDRVLDLWRQGSAVVGSSRGLMELFEKRWTLRLPNPFQLTDGLGLLGGYVAVPHFDKYALKRWGPAKGQALDKQGLGLLGLDERTALIGGSGGFSVAGAGSVTVVEESFQRVFSAGATVDLSRVVEA